MCGLDGVSLIGSGGRGRFLCGCLLLACYWLGTKPPPRQTKAGWGTQSNAENDQHQGRAGCDSSPDPEWAVARNSLRMQALEHAIFEPGERLGIAVLAQC